MQVSIKDVLSRTRISYWTFVWYRREGLLPGPLRHEKFRGKGSSAYYPLWIIERIDEIQRMRRRGLTVAEVKKAIKPRVSEKLAAIIQSSFEEGEGEEVRLYEHLSPAEVFKQIAKQAAAAYSGYFVESYRVKVKKGVQHHSWVITMRTSEVDLPKQPWPDAPPGREKRNVH